MALAHSRRPSMACLCVPHADRPACEDTAKAMSPIVRRESQCGTVLKTVPTQAAIPPACRQTRL
ncbi:MAG: hypothetical protein U9P07_02150 [Pseudomonadota bacterium]|nr:hypothetical protein [Pseudomonadota bacterium]